MRWSCMWRSMFWVSAGPVNAIRQLPPYWPIASVGLRTSGSSGRRFSTGGSLPAFTRSASIGASLNCFGILAGSVITSGKLPPVAGAWAAGAAAAAGFVAAAGAVVAAAAGFVAAAGALVAAGAVVAAGAGAPPAAGAVVAAGAGVGAAGDVQAARRAPAEAIPTVPRNVRRLKARRGMTAFLPRIQLVAHLTTPR